MKTKLFILLTTLVWTFMTVAEALEFETPRFRGSGCKRGTTSSVVSPDGKALSVLFDEFSVEVPQYDGDNDNDFTDDEDKGNKTSKRNENIDYKVCKMVIKTKIPEGKYIDSVSVSLQMRGSTFIENGARVEFRSRLNDWQGRFSKFKKNSGRIFGHLIERKRWTENNMEEDWNIDKNITIPVKSECKANQKDFVSFRLTNMLMAKAGRRAEEAYAMGTLDSNDFSGELNFKVNLKPCPTRGNNNNGRGRHNNNRGIDTDNNRNNNSNSRWRSRYARGQFAGMFQKIIENRTNRR
ncbi:MAG: DUF4360 domain-containing protein [Bacteriovoracaceae bacterium]